MGHISSEMARKLVAKGFVTGIKLEESPLGKSFFCKFYIYERQLISLFPKQEKAAVPQSLEEIHSNLWGPTPVATKSRKQYYITFIDDMSRLTHLYLLCMKNEVFSIYKEYETWCRVQLSTNIKPYTLTVIANIWEMTL